MTENQMSVLTRESIVALRGIAYGTPKAVWEKDLDELVALHGLETIDVDVSYLRGFEFRIGAAGDRSYDLENAQALSRALPDLTPSQATDERIWVTLALGDFKDYVLKRWAKYASIENAIASKVFVSDTRALIRDHSISRLWWRFYFADLVPRALGVDTLRLFFDYEDVPGEIAGRSILADSRVLVRYIKTVNDGLEGLSGAQDDPNLTAKKYIQGVGKQLNFLSGRFELGAVSDSRLDELMQIAHKNSIGAT